MIEYFGGFGYFGGSVKRTRDPWIWEFYFEGVFDFTELGESRIEL